jgi:hypothetical protein
MRPERGPQVRLVDHHRRPRTATHDRVRDHLLLRRCAEDAGDRLGAVVRVGLDHDLANVPFDGALGEEQPFADRGVGEALGDWCCRAVNGACGTSSAVRSASCWSSLARRVSSAEVLCSASWVSLASVMSCTTLRTRIG